MKNLFCVSVCLIFFSCSNLLQKNKKNSSSQIISINEGEGYIYFDIKFDSMPITNLSKSLSVLDQEDTCVVKLYLSAYKNKHIIKDSLIFDCYENNLIPENILDEFYNSFDPVMQGDIGMHFEPYNFYLPLYFVIGNKELEWTSKNFKVGEGNKW